jgi:hypothetical protein
VKFPERLARLDKFIQTKMLVRGHWGRDGDTACLLTALSPEAGGGQSTISCPTEVMPNWFASLTVYLNDSGSLEYWPEVVRRYRKLAADWQLLTSQEWRELEFAIRAAILRAVQPQVPHLLIEVFTEVITLCDQAAQSQYVPEQEWGRIHKSVQGLEPHFTYPLNRSTARMLLCATNPSAPTGATSMLFCDAMICNAITERLQIADRLIDIVLTKVEKAISCAKGEPA